MTPKLIALALRRTSASFRPAARRTSRTRSARECPGRLQRPVSAREYRRYGPECAVRSGNNRARPAICPASATNASRMRRPSSVRIGMFCRFGSVEAKRPVDAPQSNMTCAPGPYRVDVILQRIGVGRFQLAQLTPVQHARRQFMFSRQILKHIRPGGIGPGLALLAAFNPISSNRISPSCLGEPTLNLRPASS